MTKCLLCALLAIISIVALGSLSARPHRCRETTDLPRDWMKAIDPKADHYESGKMYPVELYTGALVPPGEKPPFKDHYETVWMCRWHAAQWLGYDPETKIKCCLVQFVRRSQKEKL